MLRHTALWFRYIIAHSRKSGSRSYRFHRLEIYVHVFGIVFGIVVLVLGLLIKPPAEADTAGLQTASKAKSAPFANTITGDLASAATIAGIISVCNGFGRILFGTLFDAKGFIFEMITIVIAFVVATVVLLAAAATGSVHFDNDVRTEFRAVPLPIYHKSDISGTEQRRKRKSDFVFPRRSDNGCNGSHRLRMGS